MNTQKLDLHQLKELLNSDGQKYYGNVDNDFDIEVIYHEDFGVWAKGTYSVWQTSARTYDYPGDWDSKVEIEDFGIYNEDGGYELTPEANNYLKQLLYDIL